MAQEASTCFVRDSLQAQAQTPLSRSAVVPPWKSWAKHSARRKHTPGLQGQQLLVQLQVPLFLSFPVWVDAVNLCRELSY